MSEISTAFEQLYQRKTAAQLNIQTLGSFQVWNEQGLIPAKDWGRDKTLQLFQFLIAARHRRALHKEMIIDRIWEDADQKSGDQNFKVAMHGINKALEPNRKSRTEPQFINRQGLTYQLQLSKIWIDIDAVEDWIALGNQVLSIDTGQAIKAYQEAVDIYHGVFLPNRLYEDWSSDERERIQVLVLGALISLAELVLEDNPLESVRLAQKALQIDATWEDAYRIQMQAYRSKGNRPMAIKTYQQCQKILEEEFGISPLPETKKMYKEILAL